MGIGPLGGDKSIKTDDDGSTNLQKYQDIELDVSSKSYDNWMNLIPFKTGTLCPPF